YSFSTENWKRPEEEVNFLFKLMETRLRKEGESLNRNNVKVEFTGRKEGLPEKLIEIMDYVRDITKNNTGLNLIFAINYGGRQEILDAVEKIVKKKKIKKVDEGTFRKFLYLPDVPDVDLIIRTAGEKRISNFLIWQSVYSEFYFTDVLWPDFDEEDFYKALVSYQKRKRKFGGLIK
ncbi:di-trans,poly-cis-decaprenylcistransferase, partial [bacterium]|nr:di-trans,poly-cis-decaprenylcistransferase [bacterium]